MSNAKLQAIQVLHDAFKSHPAYKKKWQDFIEMTVTQELEENGIHSLKKIQRIRSEVAIQVLNLFDPIWWEMQEDYENGKV